MRSLLARVRLGRATGLYFDGERVTVACATRTPGGTRVVPGARHPCPAGREGDMLRALAGEGALAGTVVIGLPASAVYFATVASDDAAETPEEAIPASILAGDRRRGAAICDGVAWRYRRVAYRSVAAAAPAQAHTISETLLALGIRDAALIPAPVAIHRAAARVGEVPSSWRSAVHVLVGGAKGLAILALGRTAVAWRPFASVAGAEIYSVASAVRSLASHLRDRFPLPDLDGVIVHGEHADALSEACGEQFALDSRPAPAVGLGAPAVAEALARHGLGRSHRTVDLLRPLRASPGAIATFPRRTAAALAATILCCAALLASTARKIEAGAATGLEVARREAAAWGLALDALPEAHARLDAEVVEAGVFAGSRILWAPILRDLAAALPGGVRLTSLEADNALAASDPRTGRRAFHDGLALSFDVLCEEGAAFPAGPQETLDALAACRSVRAAFRVLEAEGASRIPGTGGDAPLLAFSIGARNPEPVPASEEGD